MIVQTNWMRALPMADKITVNDLSLELATWDAPFVLVKTEQYFGPDDWAWQFLRLNHSYRRDYANALHDYRSDEESPEGAFWVTDSHQHRTARVAEQYCRKHYGLSTWLDPRYTRLPELGRGESWFFPLRRVVDSPETQCGMAPSEDVFSYYYPSNAGGYDERRAFGPHPSLQPAPSSAVWFAIDCSVPADAQMKTIETLSKVYQQGLGERKPEMPSGTQSEFEPLPLSSCPYFNVEKFEAASTLLGKHGAGTAWFAIRIETRGAIKGQIEKSLRQINEIHRGLCQEGIVAPAFRERFRTELSGPLDESGVPLSDGYFLKALVICAQLSQFGLDEAGIVDFLVAHTSAKGNASPKKASVRDNWNLGLSDRVAKYREHARQFVKGGYRWLIHAQKP